MTHCASCGATLVPPPKPIRCDDDAWRAFVVAWWARFGATPVPARELHRLPEAQVLHSVVNAFARRLGTSWRSGTAVDGHRVILVAWPKQRGQRRSVIPTLWALEEVVP